METVKYILELILGGSKWGIILISVAFLAVGGFVVWKLTSLEANLATATLNQEIMKSNMEKLELAKKEQDKTIKNYEKILETANQSNEAILKTLQQQIVQNDMIARKLSQISSKKALMKPAEFQANVNITMQIITKCFEDLSKKPIAGTSNEDFVCPLDTIPDFSK